MNLKYAELNSALPGLAAPELRAKVLAAAVGLAVANRLPLPSSPVADCAEHWNLQISALINAPLSDIREGATFDLKAACAFARQFWLLRYAALHPIGQMSFAADSPYGFFDTLAGVALHISPEMHCFCNENAKAIFQLQLTVSRLMAGDASVTFGAGL